MGQIIILSYAIIATATICFLAYYIHKKQSVITQKTDKIKELDGFIKYYKKETNRLRDSLASNIGQLQVARAEMLLMQKELETNNKPKNVRK